MCLVESNLYLTVEQRFEDTPPPVVKRLPPVHKPKSLLNYNYNEMKLRQEHNDSWKVVST